jgi:SAM-dependent methyltransferase
VTPDNSKHTVLVRDYFDARVADYDGFYDSPSWWARTFNRLFRKAVYLRRDQALTVTLRHGCRTMLDVGCGSGQNTVYFARHGVEHILGVDISAEMIRLASELAAHANVANQCHFLHLDFMNMPPPGGGTGRTGGTGILPVPSAGTAILPVNQKFDIVVACGVFDYVERADEFLAHMARFANRVIYGSFPGWTLVRSPLRKIRYALRGCPTHFYRRHELVALFEKVGFGQTEIMPVPSGHLAWATRNP